MVNERRHLFVPVEIKKTNKNTSLHEYTYTGDNF